MAFECPHLDQIHDVSPNTPEGCEECLATGDEWVHLRMCLSCGHVGCCDSSKNRHATKHAGAATGDKVARRRDAHQRAPPHGRRPLTERRPMASTETKSLFTGASGRLVAALDHADVSPSSAEA